MRFQWVLRRLSGALLMSLLAAVLLRLVIEQQSPLAFVGWVIFFAALNTPFYLTARADDLWCTRWLRRRGP